MSLGVYSETGSLAGYVPGPGEAVPTNQPVRWRLQVVNMIDTVQFARIVVRLGNASTLSPTVDGSATSSIIDVRERFVASGETQTIDFNWTILSVVPRGGLVGLNLTLNGGPTVSPVETARLGQNFRLIFELWTYNQSDFEYGWRGPSSRVGVWVQVFFNSEPL